MDERREDNPAEETSKTAGDLGEEFKRFGKQLGEAVTAAWESETSRTIREQLGEALGEVAKQLDAAGREIATREETRKLREQAERVVESVRESEVREEIQRGLLTGLKELNAQLEKMVAKLEREAPASDETSPDE